MRAFCARWRSAKRDVARKLVQQAHLFVEEIALRRARMTMPATAADEQRSATNEPLSASFQISDRVPSLRRSRSRSALPSPAAATWHRLARAVEADGRQPEAAFLDRDGRPRRAAPGGRPRAR